MKSEGNCVHKCTCPCHEEGVIIMHIMACCVGPCKICGKYIKRDMMDEHLKECHNDNGEKK